MGKYQVVVVGTDGSDTSFRAVDRAAKIAAESGAKLIVASAFTDSDHGRAGPDPDQYRNEKYRNEGNAPVYEMLRKAAARAREAGATEVEERAIEGAAVDALVQLAEDVDADLLVVGDVGNKSLVGRVVGAVPRTVSRRANTEVLVVETED
ncbi:universal stress protein [Mycobacterium asiaticum]|uniref:Universal stress protein n=1 Tax=Mycobacterium asiaticum TaxID=1790 RepID=A0A1A3MV09_MYCAS|nr:universal stress protein [Mycobacterium asiaticum]OBK13361.1 universal stress protein [Mycobacterium asiaticum]